jgi:lipoprotein NlpD
VTFLAKKMRLLTSFLLICSTLVGCVTGYQHIPAPVEDRTKNPTSSLANPSSPSQEVPNGYYAVRPGDTLIRIGLEQGQNWRDVAKWNNIENPDRIEVGQVLRVQPPTVIDANMSDQTGVVVTPVTRTQIMDPSPNVGPTREPTAASSPLKVEQSPSFDKNVQANKEASARAPAPLPLDIVFVLPSKGKVISAFDGAKNKGIDIAGKLGDPVVSAADGRVVYAGSGLRGYGNLIIIKHNNTYLTAYAHNEKILVKEDQFIKQGQKIAEMGSSEADQVKLHFEIRKMGKPVDPMPYLNSP